MIKATLRILIILATFVAAYSCSSTRRMSRFEIDYMVAEADRMIVLDDLDSAAMLIDDLARNNPDDTLVLWRQGHISRDLGSVEGRLRAERAFRKLVNLNSTSAVYHLELGKTLIDQSFEMKGRGELARAIDLDSTCEEAYLLMAQLYRRPFFIDNDIDCADSALQILNQLSRSLPSSDSGRILLAELLAVQDELDSAGTIASTVLAADANSLQANLILGYTQYRIGRFDIAAGYFARGLELMDSLERSGYESILYLITPQAAAHFAGLAPTRRDSISQEFWYAVDIDPTTAVNERQVEHYARVWLANLLYSDSRHNIAGWTTDMGETMIRMGPPDDRHRGKIYSGHSNGVPAWYWYYTSTALPCTLAFVDHMLSGNYRFPFSYSDNTGSARTAASKEVSYLNYRQIPQESTIERRRIPINLFAGAYKFYSGHELTEVQLVTFAPAIEISDRNETTLRCVVHDLERKEVWRSDQLSGFASMAGADQHDSLIGTRLTLQLPAGSCRLSIALEHTADNRFGVISDSLLIPDFNSDQPTMSDIVLGYAPSAFGSDLAIVRNDTARIVPSIDQVFQLGHPLKLYYEIYNLPTDLRSLTRFDVTYTFQFVKGSERGIKGLLGKVFPGRKESVSYTYREGGKSHNAIRDVELNVGELRPGRYALSIEINELVRGTKISGKTDLVLFE